MDVYQTIVLGMVQGLTEFLPVSSSGHLVLLQSLFGFKEPELFLDICLHLGTLLAVCVFLWRDLLSIFKTLSFLWRSPASWHLKELYDRAPAFRLLVLVAVSTLITTAVALIFKDQFEAMFSSTRMVAAAFMLTGLILWGTRLASQKQNGLANMGFLHAAIIGLAQGVAIAPGISRSGTTISCGLYLGMERGLAARFSFLLSIPAILGAAILKFDAAQIHGQAVPILAGTLVSAVTGFAALKVLVRLVLGGRLWVFAPYCCILGLVALAGSLARLL
jgi:undecaprenyl-diphosphatase